MNTKLLEELCDLQGVAGYEEEVQAVAARELKTCCDEVHQDRMGNIIGVRRATETIGSDKALKLMYCAHNDECGFLVREVTDKGYIRLTGVAGPNKMCNSGQQIRIQGTETVKGILVPTNPETEKFPKIEDMLVFTGCDPDWVKERVRFGDRATFDIPLCYMNETTVSGRNFDDRLGVFCMIEAVKKIKTLSVDLYAVASVQEEIGTRGAMVASQAIEPDIGIAIDGGCVVSPMQGAKDGWTSEIGKGAALYRADRLTVCSKPLTAFIAALAEKEGIPCHDNWHGGTDAHQIQKQGKGAHVTTIGVPTAFMHWAYGLADLDDIQATTDLLAVIAERLHEMDVHPEPWEQLHP